MKLYLFYEGTNIIDSCWEDQIPPHLKVEDGVVDKNPRTFFVEAFERAYITTQGGHSEFAKLLGVERHKAKELLFKVIWKGCGLVEEEIKACQ